MVVTVVAVLLVMRQSLLRRGGRVVRLAKQRRARSGRLTGPCIVCLILLLVRVVMLRVLVLGVLRLLLRMLQMLIVLRVLARSLNSVRRGSGSDGARVVAVPAGIVCQRSASSAVRHFEP